MLSFFKKDNSTPDFIAIGDIVTDVFIRINNAHEVTLPNNGGNELCMTFGDKIPFEFAEEIPAVGNSANAAVSVARIGLKAALIAHVGDDQHGKECIEALEKNGVGAHYVMVDKGLKTNYHYVLWFAQDRTILIKHEKFPLVMPDIGSPKWLYLSSLGENSLPFHSDLAKYLEAHPNINLVFQPGTFQMKFGTEALAPIYKKSKLFFCNLEEAERILGKETRNVTELLNGIKALGPELPVITDGPKGAYTLMDGKTVFMPAYPDTKPPYERTGAGDAFASTFTAAIALGKSAEDALKWASVNSMSVCQQVGAQKGLLKRSELEALLAQAPADWKLQNVA
jgi:ribokinase